MKEKGEDRKLLEHRVKRVNSPLGAHIEYWSSVTGRGGIPSIHVFQLLPRSSVASFKLPPSSLISLFSPTETFPSGMVRVVSQSLILFTLSFIVRLRRSYHRTPVVSLIQQTVFGCQGCNRIDVSDPHQETNCSFAMIYESPERDVS